ncbi:hypothetical protein LBMAG49_06980 [Planctomycetota bacterium]|nr:hypothetical protein LBMAG49_06980 [Planctomycetota bacterium]
MTTLCCCIAAPVLFAANLLAQVNTTVPSALFSVEGGSGSSVPFGTGQPVRFQCIYDASELAWTGPRVIHSIHLRADNSGGGTQAQKGYVVVNVLLSTTSVRAANASANFAENWGSDASYVITNLPMTLPAQPAVAGVRPFNIDLVFQVPWAYGMTPARQAGIPEPANLLIEIQILSQPPGAYRLDNLGSCQSPPVVFGNAGAGCAPSGGLPLSLEPAASMQAGSTFTWVVRNTEPSVLVMLATNLTAQGLLLGQPLPLALFDPNNPLQPPPALSSLFRFGAPDCWLNIDPLVTLVTIASAAGVASFQLPLAADRALVGQSLFAQALAYSQTANPMLLTTSIGQQSTVCGPLSVTRIYNFGSATAVSGQIGYGQGAVLEVR